MAQQQETPRARHQCVFCKYSNTSRATRCEACRGLTLPTKDSSFNQLDWKIFTFDSTPPAFETTTFDYLVSNFPAVLHRSSRAAVFAGNEAQKVLLVIVPGQQMKFLIKLNDPRPQNMRWDNGSRQRFYDVAQNILGASNILLGKYCLSWSFFFSGACSLSRFLSWTLTSGRNCVTRMRTKYVAFEMWMGPHAENRWSSVNRRRNNGKSCINFRTRRE